MIGGRSAIDPRGRRCGGADDRRRMRGPLLTFVRSESRGAALLLVACVPALVWANIGGARYETVWTTTL
jgi:hypothetical protein